MPLVTTTINIPSVLELYLAHAAPEQIIVAGDKKAPHSIESWCREREITYLSPQWQQDNYPRLSEYIGWNVVARRNFAYLEAAKNSTTPIITIDDDNISIHDEYYSDCSRLDFPFFGLQVGQGHGDWFDAGSLQFPNSGHPVVQRGMPQHVFGSNNRFSHITNANIGIIQGIILGDPDTSAVDRISRHPEVHVVSELFQSGVLVQKGTWTPVNTQNTIFRRELLPAMCLFPEFDRYDDIFASLICQRVMWPDGMHVMHGRPFVYQQRKRTDWLKDLFAEEWGAENIVEFTKLLFSMADVDRLPTIMDRVRFIHNQMVLINWWPKSVYSTAITWLEACEKVL